MQAPENRPAVVHDPSEFRGMTLKEEKEFPESACLTSREIRYCSKSFFHVPDLLLDLAFHLFGGAFVLQIRISTIRQSFPSPLQSPP